MFQAAPAAGAGVPPSEVAAAGAGAGAGADSSNSDSEEDTDVARLDAMHVDDATALEHAVDAVKAFIAENPDDAYGIAQEAKKQQTNSALALEDRVKVYYRAAFDNAVLEQTTDRVRVWAWFWVFCVCVCVCVGRGGGLDAVCICVCGCVAA